MHILQPDTYKHLNVKNFASQDASLSCKCMNEDKECNFTAFWFETASTILILTAISCFRQVREQATCCTQQ